MSAHLGERLSAFLDGEMPPGDRAAAEAHLRECAACARAIAEMASVDALAREMPVEAPAGYFDTLPGRVRSRVRAERKPRIARGTLWLATGMAAAAAVVMFAVVTPMTYRGAPSVPPSAVTAMRAPAADHEVAAPAAAPTAAPQLAARETGRLAAAPPPVLAHPVPQKGLDGFAPAQPAPERVLARDRLEKADAPRPSAASVPAETDARAKVAANVGFTAQSSEVQAAPPPPPAAPAPASAPTGAGGAVAATPADAVAKKEKPLRDEERTRQAEAKAEPPTRPQGFQENAATADKDRERADANEENKLAGAYAQAGGRRIRPEERYEILLARHPATAADARALARAWEAFARERPAERRADEARVRAIEALATAWRLGHEPSDLAAARTAATAYLASDGAAQPARVRTLLESLPAVP